MTLDDLKKNLEENCIPFEIKDWDTIIFTNEDYIYKIDSDYWALPKHPHKLDRSVSQLKLDGHLSCDIEILHLFRLQNLHHNDVFVSKAAIIDHVVFSLKRVTLIFENFFCHKTTSLYGFRM